jgi:hypothetical protein
VVNNTISKLYADGHIYQFKVPEPFGSVVSPFFAAEQAAAQQAAAQQAAAQQAQQGQAAAALPPARAPAASGTG